MSYSVLVEKDVSIRLRDGGAIARRRLPAG
jgi:hypothetical protein